MNFLKEIQTTRNMTLGYFLLEFSLSFSSLDQSEEEQESFLKELPKRCLFLAYEDPYRRCVRLTS